MDYARLRAVFGRGKTFSHGLDPKPTSAPAAGVDDLIETAKTRRHGL